jgi:hypothetical protein
MTKVIGAFRDYVKVPTKETGRERTIEGGIERKISSYEEKEKREEIN